MYQIHLHVALSLADALRAGTSRAGIGAIPLTDAQVAEIQARGLAEAASPYLDGTERSASAKSRHLDVTDQTIAAAMTALEERRDKIAAIRALAARIKSTQPSWGAALEIAAMYDGVDGPQMRATKLKDAPIDLRGGGGWLHGTTATEAVSRVHEIVARATAKPVDMWVRDEDRPWVSAEILADFDRGAAAVRDRKAEQAARDEQRAKAEKDRAAERARATAAMVAAHGTPSQIERHAAGVLPKLEIDKIEIASTFGPLDELLSVGKPGGWLVGGSTARKISGYEKGDDDSSEDNVSDEISAGMWESTAPMRAAIAKIGGTYKIESYWETSGHRCAKLKSVIVGATSPLGNDVDCEYLPPIKKPVGGTPGQVGEVFAAWDAARDAMFGPRS